MNNLSTSVNESILGSSANNASKKPPLMNSEHSSGMSNLMEKTRSFMSEGKKDLKQITSLDVDRVLEAGKKFALSTYEFAKRRPVVAVVLAGGIVVLSVWAASAVMSKSRSHANEFKHAD